MLKGILLSVEDALSNPEGALLGLMQEACAQVGADWPEAAAHAEKHLLRPEGGVDAALDAIVRHGGAERAFLDEAFAQAGAKRAAARGFELSQDWVDAIAAAQAEQIAVAFVSCFKIGGNPFSNPDLALADPAFGFAPPGVDPERLAAALDDLVSRLNLQPSEALLATERTDLIDAAGKLPCRVFTSRGDLPPKPMKAGDLVQYSGKPDVSALIYAFLDGNGE